MTVQEAQRIEEQYSTGALDPSLPGTMEIINEARKTRLDAYMWVPLQEVDRRRVACGG